MVTACSNCVYSSIWSEKRSFYRGCVYLTIGCYRNDEKKIFCIISVDMLVNF